MTSVRILFAAAASAALLGACGGGGSDAGTTPPPPAALVAITSSNQTAVARAALDGGMALTRSQVLQSDGRAGTQSAQAGTAGRLASPLSARGAVLHAARQVLLRGFPDQRRARADARSRTLAVETSTENCSLGGAVTVSFDDRDNSQVVTANDTLTLSFAQCSQAAGEVVNGSVVFTVGSVVSATASRVEFNGTMAFQQMAMSFGQAATTINGSVGVAFLSTSTVSQLGLTIGSAGLSAAVSTPQYSDTVTFEPGLRIDSTENLSTASSTTRIDGSFSSTLVRGRITVTTVQALAQSEGDSYPNAGQIRVVGASSSALRVTVLSATQVRIELDAAGDGAYEASTDVAWTTLMPG